MRPGRAVVRGLPGHVEIVVRTEAKVLPQKPPSRPPPQAPPEDGPGAFLLL